MKLEITTAGSLDSSHVLFQQQPSNPGLMIGQNIGAIETNLDIFILAVVER